MERQVKAWSSGIFWVWQGTGILFKCSRKLVEVSKSKRSEL